MQCQVRYLAKAHSKDNKAHQCQDQFPRIHKINKPASRLVNGVLAKTTSLGQKRMQNNSSRFSSIISTDAIYESLIVWICRVHWVFQSYKIMQIIKNEAERFWKDRRGIQLKVIINLRDGATETCSNIMWTAFGLLKGRHSVIKGWVSFELTQIT